MNYILVLSFEPSSFNSITRYWDLNLLIHILYPLVPLYDIESFRKYWSFNFFSFKAFTDNHKRENFDTFVIPIKIQETMFSICF